MMTSRSDKQTGGPAFPQDYEHTKVLVQMQQVGDISAKDLQKLSKQLAGMTLRDYFAAKAMQSMADKQMNVSTGDDQFNAAVLAKVAYVMADAMLKARDSVTVGRKIEELGLSVKTKNCLKADDICTVEQLTKLTSSHLLKIPNMGSKSVREIEQALFMHGLRLRDGQP